MQGGILFTAPHTARLNRIRLNGKSEIHTFEDYADVIVEGLANAVDGSYIHWKRDEEMWKTQHDPNYLHPHMLQESPFHKTLRQFRNKSGAMMHIDVHGKANRKTNRDIDIGRNAMLWHYKDGKKSDSHYNKIVMNLVHHMTKEINKVFRNVKLDKF